MHVFSHVLSSYKYIVLCYPDGSAGKESACNVGDLGSMPGLERSPGEGNSYPLQNLPGEFHGLYRPWGRKELDSTTFTFTSNTKFKN